MLEKYDYVVPLDLVATEPASPRDFSRLFVYDTKTGKIDFDIFRNLEKYLPEKSFFVFNDTKVVPARVDLKDLKGDEREFLILINEYLQGTRIVKALTYGEIENGTTFSFPDGSVLISRGREGEKVSLEMLFPVEKIHFLLDKYGKTPLPPYILKRMQEPDEQKIRQEYQSVFAKNPSSVAAPTASLHFTENVLNSCEEKGIKKEYVTLHVGMGTFAKVTENNFVSKTLHREKYEVRAESAQNMMRYKGEGRKCIAVGTTAMRVLETLAREQPVSKWGLRDLRGDTDIFIYPPYRFLMTDILITNFHVPRSSLIMLVDAFLQHKKAKHSVMELYKKAIDEKFRLFSFGDAMLIL